MLKMSPAASFGLLLSVLYPGAALSVLWTRLLRGNLHLGLPMAMLLSLLSLGIQQLNRCRNNA